MDKNYRYTIVLVNAKGQRTPIKDGLKSVRAVREIAMNVKQTRNRRVVIERDGKELVGGPSALDKELYERWLEEHQPEEKES